MNKHNTLSLTEVMLAFYKIGLSLKYELKPPDNQQCSVADMAESEGDQHSRSYVLNSHLKEKRMK
ncbi:hypothetical protein [Enterococcus sp.]|uniref:hypothetical protein n=1 Tax=Enterococcus sp. TaxID=35783 RepID=UPI0028A162BC|nr:hypothetical protein [Enterococcus sp.]